LCILLKSKNISTQLCRCTYRRMYICQSIRQHWLYYQPTQYRQWRR